MLERPAPPVPDAAARPRHAVRFARARVALPVQTGGFWVLLALALPKVVGAVFTVVLRRFLGPGASGMFDLAYTPYRFLDSFRNFGTGPALIYERRVDRDLANTAWTLNMLGAVLVTLVAQILAGPIARYYGHPQIETIFRLLSIAYVFGSISSIHYFLLLRDLDFRARSVPAVGQVMVAGLVALLFATWGFGVGTLVARELASVAVGAGLLWAIYPYRPKMFLDRELARRLLSYGAWIGAGLTIMYASQNVDVFVGGRLIGKAADIGFYTTSWTLAFVAAGIFSVVSSSMIFPSLSRVQVHTGALTATLLKAMRQMALLVLPASALLAALAPVLVVPVLGSKFAAYRSSFLVISVLGIYAGNRTLLGVFFEGYKSVGKPWLVPVYHAFKLALTAPIVVVAAHFGIVGLACSYIPIQLIEIPVALTLAHRLLRISPAQVFRAVKVPAVSTAVMAATALATEVLMLSVLHAGDLLTLGACLGLAAVAYVGSLLVMDRNLLSEARSVLLQGL